MDSYAEATFRLSGCGQMAARRCPIADKAFKV